MSFAGFLCQCDSSPLIFLNWVAHGSNESTQLQIEGLIILSLYSRPPTALCVGILFYSTKTLIPFRSRVDATASSSFFFFSLE